MQKIEFSCTKIEIRIKLLKNICEISTYILLKLLLFIEMIIMKIYFLFPIMFILTSFELIYLLSELFFSGSLTSVSLECSTFFKFP